MLVRIVRMTFAPEHVETFLGHFEDSAPKIRDFPGCHHLELWRDVDDSSIFTTHSHWQSQEALNEYRNSHLFRSTWAEVKPLFAERPEAHSYVVAQPAAEISARTSSKSDR